MLAALARKSVQVAQDPVLRRFLIGRALGRWPKLAGIEQGRPPYLGAIPADARPDGRNWPELAGGGAAGGILHLAGERVPATADLFERAFADLETLSALHRFAWVPLAGEDVGADDVNSLWRAWRDRFATPDDGPAWEAYTAAERAANLLDLGLRRGLPGRVDDTVSVLAAHAPAIAGRLEYFGPNATHNHLANNARGLYRLGCDLGMPQWAELGALILEREADQLFLPSGMLREESSHYHLLYVRNVADCWLAALRAGRDAEAGRWQALLERVWAVLPRLMLPGGMPLVGDISPDSPPGFLAGLLPGMDSRQGWTSLLPEADRARLDAVKQRVAPADPALLAHDGWLRLDREDGWSGLWHVAPQGWCFYPGHGHQDIGSFELHYASEAIFVDPGRGAYGESGEAALFRSAAVHNGLQVDGFDPYPANKPYYAGEFRSVIGGPAPQSATDESGVVLGFDGFARLPGVGRVGRRWRFTDRGFELEDEVSGKGGHRVVRRLVTPHPARLDGTHVLIETPTRRWRVTADHALSVRPGKRWLAYGHSAPAWVIEAEADVTLPWRGRLSVEEA